MIRIFFTLHIRVSQLSIRFAVFEYLLFLSIENLRIIDQRENVYFLKKYLLLVFSLQPLIVAAKI